MGGSIVARIAGHSLLDSAPRVRRLGGGRNSLPPSGERSVHIDKHTVLEGLHKTEDDNEIKAHMEKERQPQSVGPAHGPRSYNPY